MATPLPLHGVLLFAVTRVAIRGVLEVEGLGRGEG